MLNLLWMAHILRGPFPSNTTVLTLYYRRLTTVLQNGWSLCSCTWVYIRDTIWLIVKAAAIVREEHWLKGKLVWFFSFILNIRAKPDRHMWWPYKCIKTCSIFIIFKYSYIYDVPWLSNITILLNYLRRKICKSEACSLRFFSHKINTNCKEENNETVYYRNI